MSAKGYDCPVVINYSRDESYADRHFRETFGGFAMPLCEGGVEGMATKRERLEFVMRRHQRPAARLLRKLRSYVK